MKIEVSWNKVRERGKLFEMIGTYFLRWQPVEHKWVKTRFGAIFRWTGPQTKEIPEKSLPPKIANSNEMAI